MTAMAGDPVPLPQPGATVVATQPPLNPTEPSANPTQTGADNEPGVPLAGIPTSTPAATTTPIPTGTPPAGGQADSLSGSAGTSDTAGSNPSGIIAGVAALPRAGAGSPRNGNLVFAGGAVLVLLGLGFALRSARRQAR